MEGTSGYQTNAPGNNQPLAIPGVGAPSTSAQTDLGNLTGGAFAGAGPIQASGGTGGAGGAASGAGGSASIYGNIVNGPAWNLPPSFFNNPYGGQGVGLPLPLPHLGIWYIAGGVVLAAIALTIWFVRR